jgi:predicted DNA-binding protein YlxM (UPF0122 family)
MIDMKAAAMLGGDPADRPDASYWPTYDDNPEDIWADEFAEMCRAANLKVFPDHFSCGKAAFKKATDEADTKARAAHIATQTIVTWMQRAVNADIPDLRLAVKCWMSHYQLTPFSQTEIAQQEGVTRAAISKRCKEIEDMLKTDDDKHITKARGEKSQEARKTYTLRQLLVGATRERLPAITETQKRKNDKWNQLRQSYQAQN